MRPTCKLRLPNTLHPKRREDEEHPALRQAKRTQPRRNLPIRNNQRAGRILGTLEAPPRYHHSEQHNAPPSACGVTWSIAHVSSYSNPQRKPRLEVPAEAAPRHHNPVLRRHPQNHPPSLHPRISECVAERLARKQYHPSPDMPPALGRTTHDPDEE